jgi:uncharacterized protein
MLMLKSITTLVAINLLVSCSNTASYNDPIPEHDNFTVQSEHVQEQRVINVWTPPQYAESNDSYPVLYMPDGGIKEDFPHIANTISKLIEEKKIAPIILVGIENTERGRDLTGASTAEYDKQFCPMTDGAKNFRAFIYQELMPVINEKYRTTSIKGVVGESLAGLFVMETFLEHPTTFDFYIAMDPSLWWNNHYLVSNADSLLSRFPNNELTLWYAGSSAEDISVHTKALQTNLDQSAPKNLTWKYSDQPIEKHNTIFRATKEKAFIWVLRNKSKL